MRIAIAQPLMQWSGDDNAAAIVSTIERASANGAGLCVFPELAIPGFHRRIASLAKPDPVAAWLDAVERACARHAVAAVLGAPTFAGDGSIRNSAIFIDETGRTVGSVDKCGLTDPEATFFARGASRPVLRLRERSCTAILCREVEDLDQVCDDLAGAAVELVFWPGLMSPEKGFEHLDPPRHVQQAQRLARRLGAFVLQANWPNSLNYPDESAKTGASAVISPSGELLFRLPRATAGVGLFTLGESSYRWIAREG